MPLADEEGVFALDFVADADFAHHHVRQRVDEHRRACHCVTLLADDALVVKVGVERAHGIHNDYAHFFGLKLYIVKQIASSHIAQFAQIVHFVELQILVAEFLESLADERSVFG